MGSGIKDLIQKLAHLVTQLMTLIDLFSFPWHQFPFHTMVTIVVIIQCCQEDQETSFMMFLVKCLALVKALKSIGHHNHFSTLWIENELCLLCSYCCGLNKTEHTSHFSLYLLTHSWVFLPVLSLHPSSWRDSKQSE